MQNEIYSYHTFYFPFSWDCAKRDMHAYAASLYAREWQNQDVRDDAFQTGENVDAALYQAMQYFTKPAQNAIFGLGKGIVENYTLCPEKIHDTAFYHIEKNGAVYDLPLHAIRLKIFNTGIGILMFEAENRDYPSIEAVKNINAFGRRTFAPYLSDDHLLCADVLGIRYTKTHTDYENLKEVFSIKNGRPKGTMVPQFIINLLGKEICPAVDDRMFVAVALNDATYFDKIADFSADAAASADLYELIYMDTPGGCRCPTESMRRRILEKSVYTRWMACGTLHAASHDSFVCITGARDEARENVQYSVIQPFLIQYTEMVAIVLAQRASIIAFDAMAAELSAGFEKRGRNLKRKKLLQLLSLQEKYIAFQNQLMNVEITCQDQGIELYEALQNALYIEKNNNHLSGEIERLYEAANVNQAYTFNMLALWIAVLAILVPILTEYLIEK